MIRGPVSRVVKDIGKTARSITWRGWAVAAAVTMVYCMHASHHDVRQAALAARIRAYTSEAHSRTAQAYAAAEAAAAAATAVPSELIAVETDVVVKQPEAEPIASNDEPFPPPPRAPEPPPAPLAPPAQPASEGLPENRPAAAQPAEGGLCPGGIVALTYATHRGRDDRFCRMIESAVRFKVPVQVLGWGQEWVGLWQKLQGALGAVSKLPKDCIVLFTDGFDVMFMNSLEHIKAEFEKLDKPLIFSGECGCWPLVLNGPEACHSEYPPKPSKNSYRYLNSGGWIGMQKYAKDMLQYTADAARASGDKEVNDQELTSIAYVQGKLNITVDHFAKIFQSMHYIQQETKDPQQLPVCLPMDEHVRFSKGRWENYMTETTPSVFHFNGGGKRYHVEMESRLFYKRQAFWARDDRHAVYQTKVKMGGEWMSFGDVCPQHLERTRNGQSYSLQ